VFHEGSGNVEQIATFSGFNKISEENSFLVISFEAINKHWNDERESEQFQEHGRAGNDVAWIKALIPELITIYSVDTTRMYATGISNEGIFSQHRAMELSHHFSTVASLTAQIAAPLSKASSTIHAI